MTRLFPLIFLLLLALPSSARAQTVRDLYEKAVDAYNNQRYDTAVELYNDILKQAPNFAPAYVGIGLALKGKGAETEEVVHYYNEAVGHDPTNLQALEQLGRLYYGVGQYDKAEKTFLKSLKINPAQSQIRQALGWVYLIGKSRPGLAIKYFRNSGAANNPDILYGLGMAYFANNQRVEAMDAMMQLRSLGADEQAKRLEDAIRNNRRVVLDDPEHPANPDDSADLSTSTARSGIKVRLRGKLSDVN